MRTRLHLLLSSLGFFLLAACSADGITEISRESTSGGIQAGYLSLTATGDGIRIDNQTSRPVHALAVDRAAAALFDWAPCTTSPTCPAHAPATQWTIPWSAVVGYTADRREYIVYWWYDVTQPDGSLRPGNITTVIVTR